jgi:excisionase family DNA binding protein
MMQNRAPNMDVQPSSTPTDPGVDVSTASPWLTVKKGAAWAQCGRRQLYEAVQRGDLRAVRVGGRGELRFRREWIDAWLERTPASGRRSR